jgi:hypothetical protein
MLIQSIDFSCRHVLYANQARGIPLGHSISFGPMSTLHSPLYFMHFFLPLSHEGDCNVQGFTNAVKRPVRIRDLLS